MLLLLSYKLIFSYALRKGNVLVLKSFVGLDCHVFDLE